MAKIRILVVDDAVVFRRTVSEELSNDPALEVVGTAANGRIALARMAQVSPDLVILDVEMPEMDGLAALAELRKTYRRLPVIMFSSLTERGAEATLDALALGATDYFTKPASIGGLEESLKVIREQLIPKIKALFAGARAKARATTESCSTAAAPTAAGWKAEGQSPRRSGAPAWPDPGGGHRRFHRRTECPDGGLSQSAGRFSRPAGDRAAHAAHVHAPAGRTALRRVRDPRSRRQLG